MKVLKLGQRPAILRTVPTKQKPAVAAVVAPNEEVKLEPARLTKLRRLVLSPIGTSFRNLLLLVHRRRVARHRMRQQLACDRRIHHRDLLCTPATPSSYPAVSFRIPLVTPRCDV